MLSKKRSRPSQILKRLLVTHLKNLNDKCMDGFSFEQLPRNQEGRDTYKIRFTEAFHETKNQKNFSPVVYLHQLIEKIVQRYPEKLDFHKISGFLSRGLRSLASFMRESTLEHQIRPILKKRDKELIISSGPDLDAEEHTDIRIRFRQRLFRIWTYQYTMNGIPHHLERVGGLRGKLPKGIHILCPLKSEPAIKRQQLKRAIQRKQNTLRRLLLSMQEIQTSARAKAVLSEIRLLRLTIKKVKKRLYRVNEILGDNLEEVNGFYFYSNKFVRKLANSILTARRCISYRRVKERVLAPRLMLGRLMLFKV